VIAADAVLKSPPDGYTLFFGTNTAMSWVPASRKAPPYDPVADFTAISDVGRFGFFLFTNPAVPAASVAELIAYVRANPGKLNYGTGNSFSIMTTAQFKIAQKLDIVHVPYKGDAPLTIDLLGGRVQMAFATPGTALPQVKDGKLRALATLLPNRSPLMPEVPTMAEAGVAGVSLIAWGGLFGPARLPREVVDRLAREMAVALKRPDVREGLDRIAFEARSSSPEELAALVKSQLEIWRRAVQEVGIALE
jgi:tripartite-type tricarboxylate transporter receptor subunit TctC